MHFGDERMEPSIQNAFLTRCNARKKTAQRLAQRQRTKLVSSTSSQPGEGLQHVTAPGVDSRATSWFDRFGRLIQLQAFDTNLPSCGYDVYPVTYVLKTFGFLFDLLPFVTISLFFVSLLEEERSIDED